MKSHLLKIPYSRYCTIYSLEMVPEEIIALVSYILFRNSKHENSFGLFWLLIYADQASEPVTLKQWDILGRKYHFMHFLPKNSLSLWNAPKVCMHPETLIFKVQRSWLVKNILIGSFHQNHVHFLFSAHCRVRKEVNV